MRRLLFWAAAAFVFVALVPCFVAPPRGITLNQHWLESRWDSQRPGPLTVIAAAGRAYADRLDRVLHPPRTDLAADFDDPRSVLGLILGRIPTRAVVYPTETYYYYRVSIGDRRISGNFRLLDAHEGRLHIGYFDEHAPDQMRAATFTQAEGVAIQTLAENRFRVTFQGRSTTFVLPREALARPRSFDPLEFEEFVTGVLDESGYSFLLVFNTVLNGFYYVLNEERPAPEVLAAASGGGGRFLVGEESRFVFYRDAQRGRTILVGVSNSNIFANNYFDGPFDQVPPRLPLRDKLTKAYPYVKSRGGIDEHGNFLELQGQRVAISPYQTYPTLGVLIGAMNTIVDSALVPAEAWNMMTYEAKRDYLTPTSFAFDNLQGEQIWEKQGWPANHWGDTSLAWPADHSASTSAHWPANHDSAHSALKE